MVQYVLVPWRTETMTVAAGGTAKQTAYGAQNWPHPVVATFYLLFTRSPHSGYEWCSSSYVALLGNIATIYFSFSLKTARSALAAPSSCCPKYIPVFFVGRKCILALFRVLFHWQTVQSTAMCLSSIRAANFRLRVFFSCIRVCFKHSQRETEGRQDIPTQEEEMPAVTCYASWTLKSPVLGEERREKPESELLMHN